MILVREHIVNHRALLVRYLTRYWTWPPPPSPSRDSLLAASGLVVVAAVHRSKGSGFEPRVGHRRAIHNPTLARTMDTPFWGHRAPPGP